MPERNVIQSILILRFSSLGDIVMTTAMIRCLRARFPGATIDMVVREDFFDLIKNNPHLNQKIVLSRDSGFSGLKRLGEELKGRYDLVYDAHRSLRSRYLVPRLGAPQVVCFDKHYLRRALALTFKLPLLNQRRFLEKFVDPLQPLGVAYDGFGPEMFLSQDEEARLDERFLMDSKVRWIGLVPSAQWPGKRWPISHFKETVTQLASATNAKFVLFGGKNDTFCQEVVSGVARDRVLDLQGKASIAESACALKRCHFVIANDTGLLHMADALNIPAVTILGPTSGDLGCLPFHPQSIVVEENLWCRPCSKNGEAPCIRRKRYCLENISSDRVFQAAMKLWQR